MIRLACLVSFAGVLVANQLQVQRRLLIQWESTNGPYGGEARALLVHRNQVVVPSDAGVWRSTDRGRSWRPMKGRFTNGWGIAQSGPDLFVHDQKGLHRTDTIGVSWVTCGGVPGSTRSDRQLVSAGERLFYWIPDVGLFRSQDRCASWTSITVPWALDSGPIRFVVSRTAGTMVVVTVRGSFRTTDYGATWQSVSSPAQQAFTSVLISGSGLDILIGTSDGVYRSKDDGVSWTQMAFGRRWVRHMVAGQDGAIYASVATGSGEVYRTTVMRSQDEGSTWTAADEGLSGHEIAGLARDEFGTLYAASETGVYRSDRSGRWQHVGLPTFYVTSLFAAPWNSVYATAGAFGARRTVDRGATWRPLLLPSEYAGPVTTTTGGDLLMALSDGLYRSRDRGETWLKVGLHRQVSAIFTVPSTTTVLAGTDNGLFRSLDNGETWIERSIGLRSFNVTSFAAGPDGVLYAGTVAGEGEGHVYRSTNQGNRWRLVAPEFPGGPVNALVAPPTGDVIAATNGGIFRLPSDAEKWQEVKLRNDRTRVTSLVRDGSGRLIAGTSVAGVFVSEDNGETWTAANRGLPTLRIRAIAAADDGYIYLATGDAYGYPGGPVRVFKGRFASN